jgi:fibronectin-binding autotransporter adhesin
MAITSVVRSGLVGGAKYRRISDTAVPGPTEVDALVVAGGGGGGARSGRAGGGGGAGGVLQLNAEPVTPGTSYTLTVGAGGSGGLSPTGTASGLAGGDSVFGANTAVGGGTEAVIGVGGNGGSGGGSAGSNGNPPGGTGVGYNPTAWAGTGTPGQGNNGGRSYVAPGSPYVPRLWYGGGGGGWGGGPTSNDAYGLPSTDVYGNPVTRFYGGKGGSGAVATLLPTSLATTYSVGVVAPIPTGTGVYYAGGGAGQANPLDSGSPYWNGITAPSPGGIGGGGASAYGGGPYLPGANTAGGDATANTGGGGGAGGTAVPTVGGGNGGSGVVVIRQSTLYRDPTVGAGLTYVSVTDGSSRFHIFTSGTDTIRW